MAKQCSLKKDPIFKISSNSSITTTEKGKSYFTKGLENSNSANTIVNISPSPTETEGEKDGGSKPLRKSDSSTSVAFSDIIETREFENPDYKRKSKRKFSLARRFSSKSGTKWTTWQPSSSILKSIFASVFICLSVWLFSYILFDTECLPPNGSVFVLFLLELSAIILGHIFELFRLPPLLGMLAAGLAIGNLRINGEMYFKIDRRISFPIRMISVVIVLTRGAFSVNSLLIKKFPRVIPQLVLGPCIFEAIAASLAAYYILHFPVEWSALIGCIMSAMSGVGLLPYLKAYEMHDIAQNRAALIAKTSCSLDSIIAISMAEVALGFIFGQGDVGSGFKKGLLELFIGGFFGFVWGGITGQLIDNGKSTELKTVGIISGGVISLIGLTKIGYPRGSSLACYMNALVASLIWRYEKENNDNNEKIIKTFDKIWYFSQPLLFVIIGYRTDLYSVDWNFTISRGLIVLAIGLGIRVLSVYPLISCGKLTVHEKIFLMCAWIPKCTVQATIGCVAMDTALNLSLTDPDLLNYSTKIIHLSIMTIVVATSLGALISLTVSPKFLKN